MTDHNERRAAPRFDLSAPVRFFLREKQEGSGTLLNISECGLALVTEVEARSGDEIILYPDGLGRIPGRVTRAFGGGFAVAFVLSSIQRETMKDRVAAAVQGLPYFRMSEHRSSVRIRYNIETHVWFDGCEEPARCTLVDLSRTGCRVKCHDKPEVGVLVVVGALNGVVRRHTQDGFAVEFLKTSCRRHAGQRPDKLEKRGGNIVSLAGAASRHRAEQRPAKRRIINT